jgi:NAD(P)-dependent dehydrogenase (short-subunit alcohol dehydrogenase family)
VHPEEVEAVINAHPWVRMSLVSARRNAITDAVVTAGVVLADAAGSAGERPAPAALTRELEDGQREKIMRRSALRRMAAPQDVAAAVEFLLSDKARNVPGTTVTVDAGNTA